MSADLRESVIERPLKGAGQNYWVFRLAFFVILGDQFTSIYGNIPTMDSIFGAVSIELEECKCAVSRAKSAEM